MIDHALHSIRQQALSTQLGVMNADLITLEPVNATHKQYTSDNKVQSVPAPLRHSMRSLTLGKTYFYSASRKH